MVYLEVIQNHKTVRTPPYRSAADGWLYSCPGRQTPRQIISPRGGKVSGKLDILNE